MYIVAFHRGAEFGDLLMVISMWFIVTFHTVAKKTLLAQFVGKTALQMNLM